MMKYLPFLLFLLLKAGTATAQNNLVINGIPWFDDKGNIVNTHSGVSLLPIPAYIIVFVLLP